MYVYSFSPPLFSSATGAELVRGQVGGANTPQIKGPLFHPCLRQEASVCQTAGDQRGSFRSPAGTGRTTPSLWRHLSSSRMESSSWRKDSSCLLLSSATRLQHAACDLCSGSDLCQDAAITCQDRGGQVLRAGGGGGRPATLLLVPAGAPARGSGA